MHWAVNSRYFCSLLPDEFNEAFINEAFIHNAMLTYKTRCTHKVVLGAIHKDVGPFFQIYDPPSLPLSAQITK